MFDDILGKRERIRHSDKVVADKGNKYSEDHLGNSQQSVSPTRGSISSSSKNPKPKRTGKKGKPSVPAEVKVSINDNGTINEQCTDDPPDDCGCGDADCDSCLTGTMCDMRCLVCKPVEIWGQKNIDKEIIDAVIKQANESIEDPCDGSNCSACKEDCMYNMI